MCSRNGVQICHLVSTEKKNSKSNKNKKQKHYSTGLKNTDFLWSKVNFSFKTSPDESFSS